MTGLEDHSRERGELKEIAKNERYIDLIGKTAFMDLMSLFSIARLFISHDGGPVHFASLAGIDMIILFGPESPICYRPVSSNARILYSDFICSPCLSAYNHRRSPCSDNKCLKAISVDDVYKTAMERLGHRT